MNQRPFSLVVTRQGGFCPVQYLLDYLLRRDLSAAPLFQLPNGSALSRAFFTDNLTNAIGDCGLDPSRYEGHSFRIVAESAAAEKRMSDAQIKSMHGTLEVKCSCEVYP